MVKLQFLTVVKLNFLPTYEEVANGLYTVNCYVFLPLITEKHEASCTLLEDDSLILPIYAKLINYR